MRKQLAIKSDNYPADCIIITRVPKVYELTRYEVRPNEYKRICQDYGIYDSRELGVFRKWFNDVI